MSESPTKRAEAIQRHGGYKNESAGRLLRKFGSIFGGAMGAALPTGGPASRVGASLIGGFLGKGLESVGEVMEGGFPVDKSKYDIMADDFGMSHDDIFRELSRSRGS